MRLNKKGFGLIEIAAIIAISGLVAFFAARPVGNAVHDIFKGNKNQQKQVYKLSESYPIGHLDEKGKFIRMGDYKKSEDRLNLIAQEPPETLWTKFWKLGAMAVVIIVILSYLGIWPIITLWWNKIVKPKIAKVQIDLENSRTEKRTLEGQAEQIVISVDAGLKTLNDFAEIASASAMASTDPKIKEINTAIHQALVQAKKNFLLAMKTEQDSDTEDLVTELLKND